MLRRGFLRTAGSLAAVPAIGFTKAPPKNWRCLIGGNRAGKSTKAAGMIIDSGADFIVCLSATQQQVYGDMYRLLAQERDCRPSGNRISLYPAFTGPMESLGDSEIEEFWDCEFSIYKPKRIAVWAEECNPIHIHLAAKRSVITVFSSWPRTDIQESEFYQECLRMGTVEHMRMLPHFERQYCNLSLNKESKDASNNTPG